MIVVLYIAITSFEEAKQSDRENERFPPSRESKEAMLKEETSNKIRDAVEEEDTEMVKLADALANDPDLCDQNPEKSST